MNIRYLAFALPLLAGAAPPAAGDVRATMAVTVEVVTSCVAGPARSTPICSRPTRFETKISAHPGDQPLAEAAEMLGAPERSDDGLRFNAPVRTVSTLPAPAAAPDAITYRTISY